MDPLALCKPPTGRPLGPAARWLVWCLLQAVIALTLLPGPRSAAGALHAHPVAASGVAGAARSAHLADTAAVRAAFEPSVVPELRRSDQPAPRTQQALEPRDESAFGTVARHLHLFDDAGLQLDPDRPSSEGLTSSGWSTGAGAWAPGPVTGSGRLAPPGRSHGPGPARSADRWQDAELVRRKRPPRG